jgi:uncharacterized protein (TIGR03437 family)
VRHLLTFFFLTSFVWGQQTIRVTNAASGGLGTAPAATFAPGSLIRVQLNLTGFNGPLVPIDPSTVSLEIAPAGSVTLAASSDATSVTALLSDDVPPGPATITMNFNGQTSAPAPITIVPSSFGLFTQANGTGPVRTQNALTRPARPGDTVALQGTGLGTATADQVTVLLGGHPFPASSAAHLPDQPGTDEIDFQVPDDATIPYGCYVAVAVTAQSHTSNTGTLSTARGDGACVNPLSFTAGQMAQLDAGRSLYLGQVNLYDMVGHPPPVSPWFDATGFTRMESADALFLSVNAASAAAFTEPLRADDAYYGCYSVISSLASFLGGGAPLSAGNKLVLSRGAKSLDVPLENPMFPSIYRAQLPTPAMADSPDAVPSPFFEAGLWQVSGPGSATMQAFTGQLNVPPPVQIANVSSLAAIDSTQDLTVQWNGGDYTNDYTATLLLSASTTIFCRAPASGGLVTVPAALLEGLTPGPNGTGIELLMVPRGDRVTVFQAPLAAGGSVPVLFRYYPSEVVPVQIQ